MIDTDKYEGHTPAPWRLDADIDYNCDLRVGFTASHDGYSIGCLHTDKPTSQLIADAPLLLAEVIQLSKIIDFAWEVMDDQTAVEFNDLIKGLELESQWESEGILMGYCLGCSIPYPLEDMNKQRLCQECQEEVKE